MKKSLTGIALILMTVAFLTGNFSCSNSTDSGPGINLYTPEDDVKMGTQLDEQLYHNPTEYPVYANYNATNYVQAIVDSIKAGKDIQYRDIFAYKVKLILNDTVINAFALPGGYVYVYTGLLKFIDNEATLASVLGHEMAHAERRHATEHMTTQYGIQVLLNFIMGSNPSEIAKMAGNLFTGMALLKNSRDDEYEADAYSFKYLQSTAWYPGAMTYFFDKIKGNESNSTLATLLSTHPLSQDRIDAVNKLIQKAGLPAPTESNLFAQRYAQFKTILVH